MFFFINNQIWGIQLTLITFYSCGILWNTSTIYCTSMCDCWSVGLPVCLFVCLFVWMDFHLWMLSSKSKTWAAKLATQDSGAGTNVVDALWMKDEEELRSSSMQSDYLHRRKLGQILLKEKSSVSNLEVVCFGFFFTLCYPAKRTVTNYLSGLHDQMSKFTSEVFKVDSFFRFV